MQFNLQGLPQNSYKIRGLRISENNLITGKLETNITFQQTLFLFLEFTSIYSIECHDSDRNRIPIGQLSGYSIKILPILSESQQSLYQATKSAESTANALSTVSILFVLVFSGMVYALFEQMQYQIYLMFINVPYTIQQIGMFKLLTLFMFRMLPNLMHSDQYTSISLFSDNPNPPQFLGQEVYSAPAPQTFQERGNLTSSYLVNGLSFYFTLAIVGLITLSIHWLRYLYCFFHS